MAKVVVRTPAGIPQKPTLLENGKCFIVKEDYRVSAKGNTIPQGYILREMSDGWFRLHFPNGNKHFLTIGPELLLKLKVEQK